MFTDDVCRGEREAGAPVSRCPVLSNRAHTVIVQLIHVIRGLEKTNY